MFMLENFMQSYKETIPYLIRPLKLKKLRTYNLRTMYHILCLPLINFEKIQKLINNVLKYYIWEKLKFQSNRFNFYLRK